MLNKLREQVKALLNEKSTKEDVDKIALIDKQIDEVEKAQQEHQKKYQEMQTDYINLVKNTGFKTPEKLVEKTEPRSFEEIAQEILSKGEKK